MLDSLTVAPYFFSASPTFFTASPTFRLPRRRQDRDAEVVLSGGERLGTGLSRNVSTICRRALKCAPFKGRGRTPEQLMYQRICSLLAFLAAEVHTPTTY